MRDQGGDPVLHLVEGDPGQGQQGEVEGHHQDIVQDRGHPGGGHLQDHQAGQEGVLVRQAATDMPVLLLEDGLRAGVVKDVAGEEESRVAAVVAAVDHHHPVTE